MSLGLRRRGERGAAAVEFALVLPIFLMLLFGIIDFGYAINRGSIVNNAARDAVREASLGQSAADVRAVAQRGVQGLPGTAIAVSCSLPDDSPCGNFDTDAVSNGIARVTITYRHEMLTPVGIFFPGGLNLSRQAEMRIE
ncbi:pilus assembly protein [Nocardioides sp. Y6]|uniref:Pilus assembly protein n=1 Tax=Nocardioides malaquae TaxID=2773426 RepID=A0ABR9RV15_9ACTN|nr:TadE/TadG family type IV pilus assembly protein [Nocardioides malaquae]MBE7325022.1 pilus assembly protein [Nocardioides malaquae]